MSRDVAGLDLLVLDDAAQLEVGEEDAARLQSSLAQHALGGDVEHAHLGRHHDEAVLGDRQREGRRPLRSSTAPILRPSVNAIDAGPSHGSIRNEWYS